MPTGRRGVFPVDGGRFEGERLRGTVLGDGADWVIKDPMAAFEALADAAPSTTAPLQQLTAGERP